MLSDNLFSAPCPTWSYRTMSFHAHYQCNGKPCPYCRWTRSQEAAESMRQEVLSGIRQALGEDHPSMIGAMSNLAEALHDVDELSTTASMQQQSIVQVATDFWRRSPSHNCRHEQLGNHLTRTRPARSSCDDAGIGAIKAQTNVWCRASKHNVVAEIRGRSREACLGRAPS